MFIYLNDEVYKYDFLFFVFLHVYFLFVILIKLRTKRIIHLSLSQFQNGFLSSLPYLGKYLMALLAGIIADRLLNSEKISKTMTRKIFTFIGNFPLNDFILLFCIRFHLSQIYCVFE